MSKQASKPTPEPDKPVQPGPDSKPSKPSKPAEPSKATDSGAAARIVVSGSDLEVTAPGKGVADAQATGDQRASDKPAAGSSLSEIVSHTYAAHAPERARYRSSVAHAVDATYGDSDPEAVVKTTRRLVDMVYSPSQDASGADAVEGSARP